MSELPDLLSEAAIKQSAKDREYRKQYEAWVSTLDADQLAELKANGLHEPVGNGGTHGAERIDNFLPCPKTSAWFPGQPIPEDDEEEIDYDKEDITRLGELNPETLATIVRVLICPDLTKQGLRPIWYRAVVLAHCLHVRGIGERSLASLAQDMGCTRALLANYAVRLRDFGRLDSRAGHTASTRAAMSERKLWRPSSRKSKKSDQSPDSNERFPGCSQAIHKGEEGEDIQAAPEAD